MTRKKAAHDISCVVRTKDLIAALKIIRIAMANKNAILPTGFIRLAMKQEQVFLMASSLEVARTTIIDAQSGPEQEIVSCPNGGLFIGLIESIGSEYVGLTPDGTRHVVSIYKMSSPHDSPTDITATISGINPDLYFAPPDIPATPLEVPGALFSEMIGHVLPACSTNKEGLTRAEDSVLLRFYGDRLICLACDGQQYSSTTIVLPGNECEKVEMIVMKWNADALRKGIDGVIRIGQTENGGRIAFVGEKTTTMTSVFGYPHIISEKRYNEFMAAMENPDAEVSISTSDLTSLIKTAIMFGPDHEYVHPVTIAIEDDAFWIETPKREAGTFKDWIACTQTVPSEDRRTVRVDVKRLLRTISGCTTDRLLFGLKNGAPYIKEVDGVVQFRGIPNHLVHVGDA